MNLRFGSICSGIEAASVSWSSLGWEAAWFSEIDSFASELLKQKFPNTKNLGDMSLLPEKIRAGEIEAPDILCGGTPCQAFSVAGLRRSLSDDRGNLSLIFCEIANELETARIRSNLPPPIIFWENVPGVLNTKDNAFGCFMAGICGADFPLEIPDGRWPSAGIVAGPRRRVAWRTLDAQFFGVPQRRKRVFVIASSDNRFDPSKVLFERPGLFGDSCESTEKRKDTASFIESSFGAFRETDDQAGTLKASGGVIGGGSETLIIDISHSCDVIRECGDTSPTLTARMGTGGNNVPCLIDKEPIVLAENTIGRKPKNGGNGLGCSTGVSYTLNATGVHGVCNEGAVRRLTPVECERLQGLPDDWTKISYRGKPHESCPDSPRYKAIGNSWAVPVIRWLGERIEKELENRV